MTPTRPASLITSETSRARWPSTTRCPVRLDSAAITSAWCLAGRAPGWCDRSEGSHRGMSRFLFVVPPLAGHVNPAAAVAQALAGRGHDVAWVGSQARLRPLLGPEATIFPSGMRPYRGRMDTGTAAVKSLWEGFVIP